MAASPNRQTVQEVLLRGLDVRQLGEMIKRQVGLPPLPPEASAELRSIAPPPPAPPQWL